MHFFDALILLRDRLLIPQVLIFCGPRKQVQTPSLPPFIFLKFNLKFKENPYPPLSSFLKLNLRFIYNQILSTMKATGNDKVGFRASLTLLV